MSDHQALVIAHKAIQRGEPEELAALFVTNSAIRERQSRQDHLFHLPRPRLETGKRRFGYRAAALLNSQLLNSQLPSQLLRQPPASFSRSVKAAIVRGESADRH